MRYRAGLDLSRGGVAGLGVSEGCCGTNCGSVGSADSFPISVLPFKTGSSLDSDWTGACQGAARRYDLPVRALDPSGSDAALSRILSGVDRLSINVRSIRDTEARRTYPQSAFGLIACRRQMTRPISRYNHSQPEGELGSGLGYGERKANATSAERHPPA
jgi:hypothetical protein